MAKKSEPYVYGKSPNPTNWHEAANALKSLKVKPPRKPSGLMARIDTLEQLLKEQK